MIAFLRVDATDGLFTGITSDFDVIAQIDLGDWGEFLIFALVVVVSGANGIIQAIKKRREAKEREQQMPLPKSSSPPEAKPVRARPATFEREVAKARQAVPVRPATQLQPSRPSPVSKSPPTTNVPPIFETLAEAIREVNQKETRRSGRSKRRAAASEPARPVAPTRMPAKKAHQAISDRHFIAEHEREQEKSMEKRLGHVAAGVVAPTVDAYTQKTVGSRALQGVNFRQAIILREILGPPVAMRDMDDYFSP